MLERSTLNVLTYRDKIILNQILIIVFVATEYLQNFK